MRIAFITTEYVTEDFFSGGLANYTHRVAKRLVALGHEVHVVVNSPEKPSEFEDSGIRVHRVWKRGLGSAIGRVTPRFMYQPVHRILLSMESYLKLRKIHKETPLDMLQVPELFGCGLASSIFLPVPHCVVVSSYRPQTMRMRGESRGFEIRLLELIELLQMKLSRNIHTMSRALKNTLEREAGIKDIRIIRPPFYVEAGKIDYTLYEEKLAGKDYLLYFGRYELHKGFHILVQALREFMDKYPEAYAVFVGQDRPTMLSKSMREYAVSRSRNYADRLIFIDQLPHDELYPVISGAKIVALPSLVDNIPNVCLEAMGLARPVIGTVGASYDEIITDGENGFLVPAGDVGALAEKLIEAWASPGLGEIGRAASIRAEDFSPEHTVDELLSFFRAVRREYQRKH